MPADCVVPSSTPPPKPSQSPRLSPCGSAVARSPFTSPVRSPSFLPPVPHQQSRACRQACPTFEPTSPLLLPPAPSPQSVFHSPLQEKEDDASSDGSVDDAAIIASTKTFHAAGSWIVEQAPVFLCGFVVAWISLLVLWRSDGDVLRAENEAARVLIGELRHMIDALRAEGAEARRLLQAAGELKHGGAAVGQNWDSSAFGQAAVGSHSNDIVRLSVAQSHVAENVIRVGDEPSQSQLDLFFGMLSPFVLFLVDVGLVYFCLRQCASQSMRHSMESLLLLALEKLGADAWLRDPNAKLPADAAAGFQRSRPNVDISGGNAAARVEPVAADSFLVRRRDGSELAPVQREQIRRQADQLHNIRQRRSIASLAVASLASVAAMRLVVSAADAVGWRFLNHLVMYAVLTVRVCLIVLLVLF